MRCGIRSLTQQQIQLRGVVLNVPHVIEHQLEDAEVRAEILESCSGSFVGQSEYRGTGFFTAMIEVGLQFGSRVDAIWHHAGEIDLLESERCGWRESFWRFRKSKIQPKQRVINQVPKLCLSSLIAPNFIRALVDGILEHLNSCTELLPKDFPEGLVHDSG